MNKPSGMNKNAWEKLVAKLEHLDQYGVRVGVMQAEGSKPHGDEKITIAEIATIHEFGAPRAGIPERSFIRRTFDTVYKRALATRIAEMAKRVVDSGSRFDVERELGTLGLWGKAAIQKRITSGSGIPPALKPDTIAKKGSSRPLVDTGQLLDAISWEVTRS